MRHIFVWISLLFFAFTLKDKPAYQLFTAEGKAAYFDSMVKDLAEADIILFGELHNDSVTHALQFQVAQGLFKLHEQQLVMGAEMFETDVQLIIHEYLSGKIPVKNFEAEARLWQNYASDYKPLVEFARENKLPFIATNVPRRYAAAVANSGPETLQQFSPEAKQFMPPLPYPVNYELPGYKNMLKMFGGSHAGQKGNQMVAAQALKDAAMAHFILKNFQSGRKFLHFNGSYHSDNYEGIYWYLKQQQPELKIKTISTVTQKELKKLEKENHRKADFILVVPESSPKSY